MILVVGLDQTNSIKFRLHLTSNFLGRRRFGFPIGQDLVERFAMLILGDGPGNVRADLSLASDPLDALNELIRKADRDPFHTIIIRR